MFFLVYSSGFSQFANSLLSFYSIRVRDLESARKEGGWLSTLLSIIDRMEIIRANYYNKLTQYNIDSSPMRLDPSYLHFITKQQLRILVAIEIGMKNHEYVPLELISSIGNLRSGESYKTLRKLLKVKLVVHVGKKNNGYKLTYLGYDYLALHTFMKRGIIKDVICKIGVGKESDIYKCQAMDGSHIVLKLTRLGRRSFKTIKNNREYIQGRKSYNWLYLSRLSSMREFTFMQILHEDGFPTPRPIDTNRHAIVMSLIDGDPLCNIKKIGDHCSVKKIFLNSLQLVKRFATRGLIHGDFNQFNLLINDSGKLTVIDFPQCISSNHPNAKQYFDRDVECLYTFFDRMMHKCVRQDYDGLSTVNQEDKGFNVATVSMPVLGEIEVEKRFDLEVRARGHFKLTQEKELEEFMKEWNAQKQEFYKQGPAKEGEVDDSQDEEQGEDMQDIEEKTKESQAVFEKLIETEHQQKEKVAMKFDQNDDDIKDLINELKEIDLMPNKQQEKVQPKEEKQESSSQESEEEEPNPNMREEWKGLTAFQIRQILKQEKKKLRQKKKAEMTTQQYIKKALGKKKGHQRAPLSKGNYGAKAKTKAKNQSIKQGMQLTL